VSLASAIVFGLSFGTILTLIVTPAMLALPDRLRELIAKLPKLGKVVKLPSKAKPVT
jgi:multidrug efflux pump